MPGYDTEGVFHTGDVIRWGGLYMDMLYGVLYVGAGLNGGVIYRGELYRGVVYGERYLVAAWGSIT